MKKAVITILMALPFVLIVIISVAGMILSEYTNIAVEAVSFVDEDENIIDSVSIGKNFTYQLMVQVYPKKATNRQVSYSSSNTSCVTVSSDGVATGVDYGSSVITVTTSDGRKTASLVMEVSDKHPLSVTLDRSEATVYEGGYIDLVASVEPYTAENKAVTWTSSDPSVATVGVNGRVTAVAEGQTIITVTTVDGGLTAQCVVTVEGASPLRWRPYPEGSAVHTITDKTYDLFDLLLYDDSIIDKNEIKFEIRSGSADGTLGGENNSVITFNGNGIIRVLVSADEYRAEVLLRFGGTI